MVVGVLDRNIWEDIANQNVKLRKSSFTLVILLSILISFVSNASILKEKVSDLNFPPQTEDVQVKFKDSHVLCVRCMFLWYYFFHFSPVPVSIPWFTRDVLEYYTLYIPPPLPKRCIFTSTCIFHLNERYTRCRHFPYTYREKCSTCVHLLPI